LLAQLHCWIDGSIFGWRSRLFYGSNWCLDWSLWLNRSNRSWYWRYGRYYGLGRIYDGLWGYYWIHEYFSLFIQMLNLYAF
jgi:hypothetical protein